MADAEGQEGGEESADGVAGEPYTGAGRDFVAGVPATLLETVIKSAKFV